MKPILTYHPSSDSARNRRVVELLDTSGVDYKTQAEGPPGTDPVVVCGAERVAPKNRQALATFLQSHGGKLEDS